MLKALYARWFQKYRTNRFPDAPPNLPERFRGRPVLAGALTADETFRKALDVCPARALFAEDKQIGLDLGKCIFCGKCSALDSRINWSKEYRMGVFKRDGLLIRPGMEEAIPEQLDAGIRALYGKSLAIRQVSAGGCAACELDFNVLNTLAWDMGRFGIKVAASPRHADALLITGPVTPNMRLALQKTYDAMPKPSLVIVSGACAISGGLYRNEEKSQCGVEGVLPVDLYVPGCPPHPATLLEALVRFIGRRQQNNDPK